MKLRGCNSGVFFNEMENKRIVCFGTSKYTETFCMETNNNNWLRQIDFFVDNNTYGKKYGFSGYSWDVKHPDVLQNLCSGTLVICIGPLENIYDVVMQLQKMSIPDTVDCYALKMVMLEGVYDNSVIHTLKSSEIKIEKTIHSFWFSKEKKPLRYQERVDSWKRICPEFEIKEWSADNYDITKNRYMKQAYDKKMWAFVSDYARLDVIYQYGGVYLDMDVEILKPLDDILCHDAFFSFDSGNFVDLGTGFGAVREHKIVGDLRKVYDEQEFVYNYGKIDCSKTVPQPMLLLPTFEKFGFKRNNKSQVINDVVFYSPDYFRIITDSSHKFRDFKGDEYAVHWHHAGWYDKETYDMRENWLVYMRKLKMLFHSV